MLRFGRGTSKASSDLSGLLVERTTLQVYPAEHLICSLGNGPRSWFFLCLQHQVLCKQGEVGDQFYAIIESRTDKGRVVDATDLTVNYPTGGAHEATQIQPQEYLRVCS